jgi:hypothetical protein
VLDSKATKQNAALESTLLADATSTAGTGAWPSPPARQRLARSHKPPGVPLRGVHEPHHGSLRGPHESTKFAGKKARGVRGPRPLGAGMDASACTSPQVLPQRGHDLRRLLGSRASRECGTGGVNHAPHLSPAATPSEVSDLQANTAGDSDSRPWGQRSTPQHGPGSESTCRKASTRGPWAHRDLRAISRLRVGYPKQSPSLTLTALSGPPRRSVGVSQGESGVRS